ncbi:unnamed protein product [Schistosoma turkestanicum]|nr:unnamed protein product [Schistosoma turkestanicum]
MGLRYETMLGKYIRGRKLGSGTYGTVYLATDKNTGQDFAIKMVGINDNESCVPASTIREIGILLELNNFGCDNIIRIHEIIHKKRHISIVYELADWNLKEFMDRFAVKDLKNETLRRLPFELTKSFLGQILEGLIVCHKHSIIHRDLKPTNILITTYGIVKIADFGLSRTLSIPYRSLCHEVITLWYRAPEIMLGVQNYDYSVDVWSLGCIAYEMIQGKVLFPGDSEIGQLYLIFEKLGTPTSDTWSGCEKLVNYNSELPKFKAIGFDEEKFTEDWKYIIQNTICLNPMERIPLECIRVNTSVREKTIIPLQAYIDKTI